MGLKACHSSGREERRSEKKLKMAQCMKDKIRETQENKNMTLKDFNSLVILCQVLNVTFGRGYNVT
jgi:hypothetical protein